MRWIATAIGIAMMIVSAIALLLTVHELVRALRLGGAAGAYNSGKVVFDGVFALLTLLIGAILLRKHLRQHMPRFVFFVTIVVLIFSGIASGYMG